MEVVRSVLAVGEPFFFWFELNPGEGTGSLSPDYSRGCRIFLRAFLRRLEKLRTTRLVYHWIGIAEESCVYGRATSRTRATSI